MCEPRAQQGRGRSCPLWEALAVSGAGGTGLHFQILILNPAALSVPSVVETKTRDTGDGDTEEPDEGREMG